MNNFNNNQISYDNMSYATVLTMTIVILISLYRFFNKKLRNKLIIIEGNIGTGKTTFLKMLEQCGCEVIYEPVNIWQTTCNDDGKSLLETFYSDMTRWAYSMQSFVFKTRLHALTKPQVSRVRYVERSVYTDRMVFAKNCYHNKTMNLLEWNMYTSWFDWILKLYAKAGYKTVPDGYIYLKAFPEISFRRVSLRKREEESTIPLDYLIQLNTLHDEWLLKTEENVLVIDCNNDFENNEKKFNNIKKSIIAFIEQI
tara:strand:- start:6962 stop:7726 length:765 start_codon:yes stop_codon:yes gene_type:complete